MNSFEDIEVWKERRKFRMEVSNLVKTFPSDEEFGMNTGAVRFKIMAPDIKHASRKVIPLKKRNS